MKKLLLVILCLTLVSPAFAFADNGKEKGEKNGNKTVVMNQKEEMKSSKNDDDDDDHKGKYRPASTTLPIQIKTKKVNYFLCKEATGWNVISLEGERNKNSSNALGDLCKKLPHGFVKKFGIHNATTTPADTTAPIISSIVGVATSGSTATISWKTNEVANASLYVSTTFPVSLTTATQSVSGFTTAHSINLTGLTASTTYYYAFKSADASGNVATSSEYSLVTPARLAIANLAVTNIASTTATVGWTTNATTTGTLSYVVGTSTTAVATSTASTTHIFNLVGLTANTTYNFIAQAIDAFNNIVVTLTTSFTTTP